MSFLAGVSQVKGALNYQVSLLDHTLVHFFFLELYNPIPGEQGIHDRDVELLEQSHVIVAEVTQPSLGVGYEIGRAVAMNKPILAMYRPQASDFINKMHFFI